MLGGRYEITQILGQGGFGITYLAKDHQKPSKPPCVVKELLSQHHNTLAEELFEKEAQTLETLGKHPQIPALLAHFTEDQKFYIVQEYIQGQVLEKEIISGKQFDETYVTKLLEDTLEVLSFVHEQGVIHCDIKPQNLIREHNSDKICLIDFGIVKEFATQMLNKRSRPRNSIIAGTVGYMPAEQGRGKTVFASDIYALGITAIQALTGLPPQDIEEDAETVELVWQNQVNISNHLAKILTTMVRRHYSLRYTNAKEALKALTELNTSITLPTILLPDTINNRARNVYAEEVATRIQKGNGEFSVVALRMLELKRNELSLSETEAQEIRETVIQNYLEQKHQQEQIKEKYQRNLKEYEEVLMVAVNKEYPLNTTVIKELEEYRQYLGLTEVDAKTLEKQILAKLTTEDLGNGVILELVPIPGGAFLMGSPEHELERVATESPQQQITVKPFFMGKYPITQTQWKVISSLPKVKIDLKSDPSHFKGINRPVEKITWDDAQEFCARLSKKTGKLYRLPSEAEWEYACRAGTTTPFYFGSTINTNQANYNGNYTYAGGDRGIDREETTNVGIFPPNAFNLYDMHGNVREWCEDEWHNNYIGIPTDGRAWVVDGNSDLKVLRGGSCDLIPKFCRSAYRNRLSRNDGYSLVGFRVVLAALFSS